MTDRGEVSKKQTQTNRYGNIVSFDAVALDRGNADAITFSKENPMIDRLFFTLGALSAGISVAAGAFGAHVLKEKISPELLTVFEVGARYQMYHALALLATAWALGRWPGALITAGGWLFVVGTVLFSGSLYALSLSGIRTLGMITPMGGVAFLAGWLCLAIAAWKA